MGGRGESEWLLAWRAEAHNGLKGSRDLGGLRLALVCLSKRKSKVRKVRAAEDAGAPLTASSHPVHIKHHARAIHQGLGTLFCTPNCPCPLTRNSARRSHALLASSLPSPAAPSSLPRPSAQVHHLNRTPADTTDAIGAADLVQDLYLRELKNYKVPQVKPTDAEGQVQKFSIPAAPKSPEEADIANELNAYETQQPDVGTEATAEDGQVLPDEDWFVEEDESITTPGATH